MAAFHVFVDGATDATPTGVARLAEAIAKHYGLPAADLLARLQRGRFRVKANTDRATADTYVRDLAKLGARCTIEEATAANSQRTTPAPFPAVTPPRTTTPPSGLAAAGAPAASRTTTPPSGLAAAGAPAASRTTTPPSVLAAAGAPAASRTTTPPSALAAAGAPAASRTTTPPSGLAAAQSAGKSAGAGAADFQSGLSAAFSGEMPAADLGALGREDSAFSLASVDGADDSEQPAAGAFAPPGGGALPASIGPAPDKPKAATPADKKARPKDEPLDMFAPPEMQGEEFKVDIAADEQEVSARKRASTPPPTEAEPGTRSSSPKIPTTPASQRIPTTPAHGTPAGAAMPARGSQPSLATSSAQTGVVAPSRFGPLAEPRVRFAAGVILAVLLGFVPAHFIAKMREESAYAEIDRKVIAAQQLADTPEVYATLDRLRADQLARKEGEQRNAAIIGFAIWALVGAGIAFVWFKKIPWDA